MQEAPEHHDCVIHPVGDPMSGQCTRHEVFAFLPPEPPKDVASPEARAESAATPWFLSGAAPLEADQDTGRLRVPADGLCMLERVGPDTFRSLCHQDAGLLRLPQLDGMIASRKLVPATPAAMCGRTEELTFDLTSGRFRCAARMKDPCHSALSIVLPDGADPGPVQFACRPTNASVHLANPCPEGTWLIQTAEAPSPVFSCINPCGDGSKPKADGTGAYVCETL